VYAAISVYSLRWSDIGYRDRHSVSGQAGVSEPLFKGDFPLGAPSSHSSHIVSSEGKLASYLTPCLNSRSLRDPQEPETRAEQNRPLSAPRAPTGEPDLAPRIGETLRQLCLHIVRERERKPPTTNFRHAKSEEKGFRVRYPLGTCSAGYLIYWKLSSYSTEIRDYKVCFRRNGGELIHFCFLCYNMSGRLTSLGRWQVCEDFSRR